MTSPLSAARLSVSGPGLAAALDAVRFAAGTDPELPVLAGVHLDAEGDALHLVATDRYRMAVARTAASGQGAAACRRPCRCRSPMRCGRCWTARTRCASPWTTGA